MPFYDNNTQEYAVIVWKTWASNANRLKEWTIRADNGQVGSVSQHPVCIEFIGAFLIRIKIAVKANKGT
jgi:hypothetical protein